MKNYKFDKKLLDMLPHSVVVLDPGGKLVFTNDLFEKEFAYCREGCEDFDEFLDKKFVGSNYYEVVKGHWKEYKKLRIGFSDAYRGLNGDHETGIYKYTFATYDESLTLVYIENITKYKQTLNDLVSSEERYRALSDASNDAVFITDNDRILEVNRASVEMFKYNYDDLLGKPFFDLIAIESKNHVIKNLMKGYEKAFEVSGIKKDYNKFPISLRTKVLDYKGKRLRVIIVNDLSELRNAEDSLRREGALVEGIMNSIPDLVFIKNFYNEFVECNDAFLDFVGKTRDGIVGQKKLDGLSFEVNKDFLNLNDSFFLSDETSIREEIDVFPSTGGKMILDVVKNIYRSPNGEFLGVIGVCRDITMINDAKEEILNAYKVKSEFLANISHEIRTPMNGIMGMTQLMETTKLNAEQKEYVKVIKNSSSSLLDIIDAIISISNIRSGSITLDEFRFDLSKLVSEIAKMFSYKAEAKNIEFNLNLDENVPQFIYGDPEKIKQIIEPLLSNAVKFTDQGSVEFSVRLAGAASSIVNVDRDMVSLKFLIQDTGIGLKEHVFDELKNPFTQGDASSTRVYGGTGAGLTISSELIKLLGGNLVMTPDYESGTSFEFEITYMVDRKI